MGIKWICAVVVVVIVAVQHTEAANQHRYWGPFSRTKKLAAGKKNTDSFERVKRGGDEDDDDHEGDDERNDDRTSNIARAITMVIILVISLIFGMLPLKTLSMKYRSRIASIANCFGGGVFFGTCFMHLIPEVKSQLTQYVDYVETQVTKDLAEGELPPAYLEFLEKLPIPEFLECSGFLLILSIEKIAESAKKIRPLTQRFSVFISSRKLSAAQKLVNRQQDLEAIPDGCEGDHEEEADCEECNDNCHSESDTEIKCTSNIDHERKISESAMSERSSCTSSKQRNVIPRAFLAAMKGNLYKRASSNGPEEPVVPGQQKKSAAMLILALSIHSFFEGLAIGVEGTETVFIQLAAAITVHKCVIAFAVGSRLIHSGKTPCGMFWCLFCMCVMTPIGISLAMIIVTTLDSNTILVVSGTIQGISTGFFLYITFAEMLFQEMKSKHDSFLKVSFMTLGVMLVTASTIWHNWNGAHAHD